MSKKPLIEPPPDASARIDRLIEFTNSCWELKLASWKALYPGITEAEIRTRALETVLANNAWHRPAPR